MTAFWCVDVGSTFTKCPSNPLGIKGCGEAGAIAAPAAVINAITDAIGSENLAMPATSQAVWAAIRKAAVEHARAVVIGGGLLGLEAAVGLARLGVDRSEAIAFEDSAAGIRSALDAGLPVLATRSRYTASHCLDGAFSAVSDLGEPGAPHRHIAGVEWPDGVVTLAALRDWHARAV